MNKKEQATQAIESHNIISRLLSGGGAIVSSNDCSELEIADAMATGRMLVRDDGMGFVCRTKEWLALQLAREVAHPNTGARYS